MENPPKSFTETNFMHQFIQESEIKSKTVMLPSYRNQSIDLPSYRNHSIDLQTKTIDWFLYEGNTGISWVNNLYILQVKKKTRT